jgi:valyl-tRNA synthetase
MSENGEKNDFVAPNIPEVFLKPYSAEESEKALYTLWEESGFFNPDVCIEKSVTLKDAEPFSIVLPPPNVTGTLHMGHAAMLAIEDTLVRYHRMQGKKTLWVPGTDSAAIATQSKVEKEIYKSENKSRHDLGREELLKRINAFAEASKDTIINQTKRMGSSLDWSRYAFTLDDKRYRAVTEAFRRMYDAGLIYRGSRIVNWDPNLQTTVSDDEIEHVEQKDNFYFLQYGPFVIGTARPETKFGDKYVVMHPDDARYKEYSHGQKIELEWINGPITATVIKDESIDMEFGTGVMTITPWHSAIDFEIAERHRLDKEQIINERGILLPIAGEFEGQHIKKARAKIIEKLQSKGLVVKIDEGYVHNVATNSRGGGTIEPQIKMQWFVDVNKEFTMGHSEIPGVKEGDAVSLKLLMQKAVEGGGISIFPDRFDKTYYHWIKNLRDWCISRQIWYGHRIPVWYRRTLGGPHQAKHFDKETLLEKLGLASDDEFRVKAFEWQPLPDLPDYAQVGGSPNIQIGIRLLTILKDRGLIDDEWIKRAEIIQPTYKEEEIYCGTEAPSGEGWEQDPDTLDTWFSSGLWTFSTLGWPEKTEDLMTYHPTTLLETGYDILFFWVARMVLMSTFLTGQVPFKNVYLHGLVRDSKGKKMSKSLGNVIDPLDMIEKYGADATRLSLIMGAAPGNDVPLSEDKVRGYKHFANKLWNITRFVLSNTENVNLDAELTQTDTDALTRIAALTAEVDQNIQKYRIDMAADVLYHYTWDFFAAEFIEASKPILNGTDLKAKESRQRALAEMLISLLKLLHPFMPFVTEAVWQNIPAALKEGERDLLMVATWPNA